MPKRIVVECESQLVLDILNKMIEKFGSGMRPAMKEIGEQLTESAKRRFDSSTSPEGYPWKPLAEGTVLARLQKIAKAYNAPNGKNIKKGTAGKLNAKGSRAVMRMKPLIDTGGLKRHIRYQVIDGGTGVEVGTDRFADEWEGGAAVHQFGTNRAGKKHNITIPARPFLGLSKNDETMVLDILNKFIEEAAQMQHNHPRRKT